MLYARTTPACILTIQATKPGCKPSTPGAMAVFKGIATWQLVVLLVQLLFGNSYLLLHASPDCCSLDDYSRLAFLSFILVLTTIAAAAIFSPIMAISSAQLKAAAAAGWMPRAFLLLAIGLSAASNFLAVTTFESGYAYRKGRVYSRHTLPVVVMVIMGIEHGCAAFMVAVAQD